MSLDTAAAIGSGGTVIVAAAGWWLAQRKDSRESEDHDRVLAELVDKSIADYLARLEARIGAQDARIMTLETKLADSHDALDKERAQRRCLDRKVAGLEHERMGWTIRVKTLEGQVRKLGGTPDP